MQNPPGSYPPNQGYQPGGFQTPGGYPPVGPTGGKTKTLNLDYNVAATLANVPICGINLITSIIWLVTEPKESRFVRFYALQSIMLLVGVIALEIVAAIVLTIVGFIAGQISGGLALVVGLIAMVVYFGVLLAYVGLEIMACIKAYGNTMWKMPVVGNFAEGKL